MDTYYEILDVAMDADQSSIKNAYRKAAAAVHPDKGGNSALFRTVQKAYEVLGDPVSRREYDKSLKDGGREHQHDTGNTKTHQDQGQEKTYQDHGQEKTYQHQGQEKTYNDENEYYNNDPDDNFEVPKPTYNVVYKIIAQRPWIFSFVITGILIKFNIYSLAMLMLGLSIISVLGTPKSRVATSVHRNSKLKNRDIDNMSGAEFELFLVDLLKSQGYKVTHTGKPGDFGADIIFETRSVKYVVQAKRSSSNVGSTAVSEVVGAKAHYGATEAVVITNARFTQSAKKLAKSNKVLLWDRDKIECLLETADPETTFSAALDTYIRSIAYGALRVMKIALVGILAIFFFRSESKKLN